MASAILRKVGGSVMVAIPPAALDELHLAAGATVELTLSEGRLSIAPSRRRYSLDELLTDCDVDGAQADDDWLADGPVGREAI